MHAGAVHDTQGLMMPEDGAVGAVRGDPDMDRSPVPANRLDQRVLGVWRVQALVSYVPMLLGMAVLAWVLARISEVPLLMALAPAILTAVWLVLSLTAIPAYRYRRWRWEVTADEIRLQRGVIIIQRTVIPMVRVQHVDTSQGPINGAFGLSEVHVSTAAGKHSIPALADAHAAELRDRIAELARIGDDGGL